MQVKLENMKNGGDERTPWAPTERNVIWLVQSPSILILLPAPMNESIINNQKLSGQPHVTIKMRLHCTILLVLWLLPLYLKFPKQMTNDNRIDDKY